MQSRPYARADLPDLLALVSGVAAARWPGSAYMMTGDVAWQIAGAEAEQNIRLWHDDAGLVAYAWFDPPSDIGFDMRPDVPLAGRTPGEILAWAEGRRRELPPHDPAILECRSMADWEALFGAPGPTPDPARMVLVATAFERDERRVELLEARGFAATGHFTPHLRRSLEAPIPEPSLPDGARLRPVTEADLAERVAVHRDAWWPASGFDLAQYRGVRSLDNYHPELDLVLEIEDGTFASYCIAWLDPAMGVGSFEPVGTRRAWRRRGAARLVGYEGLRRLKAKGMHTANVQTAGFNEPAIRLYESCGFEVVDVERSFSKSV